MHVTCQCGHRVEVFAGTVSRCPHCLAPNEPLRDVIPIAPDQPRHYIHLELLGPTAFRDLSFLPGMDRPPPRPPDPPDPPRSD